MSKPTVTPKPYVLQDMLETQRRGKPVYFGGLTGIGPKYTENLQDAVVFDSKSEAMASSAYSHPLCFFEPVEIGCLPPVSLNYPRSQIH